MSTAEELAGHVTGGTLEIESAESITLDQIAQLANAGKLIGIPAGAAITYMNMSWGMGSNRFNLTWRMPPSE